MNRIHNTLGKLYFSHLEPSSNIIITAEHASWRIPRYLKDLGLQHDEVHESKDLYDLGSLDLAKYLVDNFYCSYLYSNISRLVIDHNRFFEASTKNDNKHHSALVKKQVLVEREGKELMVDIPHNVNMTEKEELELYNEVCIPYQQELTRMVEELQKEHDHVYLVAIHSFFPTYNGDVRDIDINFMPYTNSHAPEVCAAIRDFNPNYKTEIDKPWTAMSVDGGVYHIVKDMPNISTIFFDVKNSHLQTTSGIAHVGNALSIGIDAQISKQAAKNSEQQKKGDTLDFVTA